jgi:preprotein translocase subunit SecG
MENVLLIVLLLLALALIGVVLLQRSEGGGLGMGGGGPSGQRAAATGLTKLTWVFGIAFMAVSLTLTVLASRNAEGTSVMDSLGGISAPTAEPGAIDTDALLPPPATTDPDAPLVPRAD